MLIGVISDIHANPYALDVVLNELKQHKVEAILCAGDLVGYSPLINETMELIKTENIPTVLGNHDSYLINGCPDSKSPLVKISTALTKEAISPKFLTYITTLDQEKTIEHGGLRIKIVHGSPFDPLEDYIYPDREIPAETFFQDNEDIIILGHTHHQMLRSSGKKLILNPGSCGQARDKRGYACYAIIDTCGEGGISVNFKRTKYDYNKLQVALAKNNWPIEFIQALQPT